MVKCGEKIEKIEVVRKSYRKFSRDFRQANLPSEKIPDVCFSHFNHDHKKLHNLICNGSRTKEKGAPFIQKWPGIQETPKD